MRRLALLLLLSACAAPEVVPAPEAATVTDWPAEPAPAPQPAENHAPAVAATKGYRQAERGEAQAVTGPAATAESISAVHYADRAARRALRLLIAQDGRPTAAAIALARQTLEELIRALEAPR